MDGEYAQLAIKKDDKGHVARRQAVHRTMTQQHFSIPEDADYKRAKIDNQPDEIIITLPKLT